MKRGTFKDKPRKPMKRTQLRSKTPLNSSKKAPRKRLTPKTRPKGYVAPKWFTRLKLGSHGSTPAQKKYWKVISDTYRELDFKQYAGKCVSCGKVLEDWHDGDLAHFKRYSVCNSWFKFQRENLALSCKGCNRNDDGIVGHAFGEELKRRHHPHIIEWIESENEKYRGQKMEVWEIVEKISTLRPDLVT